MCTFERQLYSCGLHAKSGWDRLDYSCNETGKRRQRNGGCVRTAANSRDHTTNDTCTTCPRPDDWMNDYFDFDKYGGAGGSGSGGNHGAVSGGYGASGGGARGSASRPQGHPSQPAGSDGYKSRPAAPAGRAPRPAAPSGHASRPAAPSGHRKK